jgi:hypothetical protein
MSLAHDSRRAPADPVEAFTLRCWARARLYGLGEYENLPDAVDALQAFAVKLGLVTSIGQDAVQAIMAAAFELVRAAEHGVNNTKSETADDDRDDDDHDDNRDDDHGDDYDGISNTFAAACRAADAKIGKRPELEDIPPGCASAAALQRDYEASIRRHRERYGAPEATLLAAEFLIGQSNLKRFDDWMADRSAYERAAIYRGLDQRKAQRERAKAFNNKLNGKAKATP